MLGNFEGVFSFAGFLKQDVLVKPKWKMQFTAYSYIKLLPNHFQNEVKGQIFQ